MTQEITLFSQRNRSKTITFQMGDKKKEIIIIKESKNLLNILITNLKREEAENSLRETHKGES